MSQSVSQSVTRSPIELSAGQLKMFNLSHCPPRLLLQSQTSSLAISSRFKAKNLKHNFCSVNLTVGLQYWSNEIIDSSPQPEVVIFDKDGTLVSILESVASV